MTGGETCRIAGAVCGGCLSLHRLRTFRRDRRLSLHRLLDFRLQRALGAAELPRRNAGRRLVEGCWAPVCGVVAGRAFRRAELPLLSGDGRLLPGGRLRLHALRLHRRRRGTLNRRGRLALRRRPFTLLRRLIDRIDDGLREHHRRRRNGRRGQSVRGHGSQKRQQ